MWTVCLLVAAVVVAVVNAQETVTAPAEAEAPDACITYVQEASSKFKDRTKFAVRQDTSIIASLELIERHSFHRCEPIEEKFGIDVDMRGWWVFKGCGGMFEVKECDASADISPPEDIVSVRKPGMMDFFPIDLPKEEMVV
ncbi:hypothetical protein ScPMuIL_001696 [Solemya velum]